MVHCLYYLVADMTQGIFAMMSATTYFGFIVGGAIGYYKKLKRSKAEVLSKVVHCCQGTVCLREVGS